jgi:hypothetical protein
LRGTFVVAPNNVAAGNVADKTARRAAPPSALPGMIAPLLRLATTALAGNRLRETVREAASEATNRLLLSAAAFLGGAVAIFCFSNVALTLMERRLDPAEAWAILGVFYASAGIAFYFFATRRRRV